MIEFGCQVAFSAVKVDAEGRLAFVDAPLLAIQPYFDVGTPYDPDNWEADGQARLSHFLVRPFPGHEWNHFFLYLLQQRPVELAQTLAGGLAGADASADQGEIEPASVEDAAASLERFDGWLTAFTDMAGRRRADRLRQAAERFVGPDAYVKTSFSAAARPSAHRSVRIGRLLDETYLHMAFTAESFGLAMDVWLLEALGEDVDDYVSDRARRNPLFLRLQRLGRRAGMEFLEAWHRQSYRYPPFTANFVRTLDGLNLSREAFGEREE